MFNRLMSLFRPKPADPYDQFVVAFIEECGRQGRKPTSYDHQTRSFVFGDPKGSDYRTVFLDNNFRRWCQGSPKARAEQLSRFVRSLGETGAGIDPANLAAELMPGIRPRVLFSHALIQTRIQGAPEGNDNEPAWTPFCGELVACVVRDRQDSMSLVTRSDLDQAKLSFDQAMAHAMAQFRAKAPAPDFEPDPRAPGLYYCGNLEDYQSSLLLMTPGKDFKLPALDGDAVALVPGRNQFFVTGSRNRPALKTTRPGRNRGTATAFLLLGAIGLARWPLGQIPVRSWNERSPQAASGRHCATCIKLQPAERAARSPLRIAEQRHSRRELHGLPKEESAGIGILQCCRPSLGRRRHVVACGRPPHLRRSDHRSANRPGRGGASRDRICTLVGRHGRRRPFVGASSEPPSSEVQESRLPQRGDVGQVASEKHCGLGRDFKTTYCNGHRRARALRCAPAMHIARTRPDGRASIPEDWCARQDSNLHCTPSEGAASLPLGYWRSGLTVSRRHIGPRLIGANPGVLRTTVHRFFHC